jgi:hypothetical protein
MLEKAVGSSCMPLSDGEAHRLVCVCVCVCVWPVWESSEESSDDEVWGTRASEFREKKRGKGKDRTWATFWGAHQRFFYQLCCAAKVGALTSSRCVCADARGRTPLRVVAPDRGCGGDGGRHRAI